jgi:hypothetical protein
MELRKNKEIKSFILGALQIDWTEVIYLMLLPDRVAK